jgi:hypothetical protein
MSTAKRRWILCGLGLLGGLLCWPFTELVLRFQAAFPSYLVFSIALGALCGLILGAFFGSAYGITSYVKKRIAMGMLNGALVGIVGGILGFLIGQGVLFLLGNLILTSQKNVELIGLPIARGLGWAFVGVFLGMSEGIRILSLKKTAVGALGGFIGGLLGGLLLEYAHVLLPAFVYGRLLGLVLLGLLIGFFYGLVEKQLSFGVLRILNGPYKGKEYLVGQARMTVGSGARCHISLAGYRDVADVHADVAAKRGEVTLRQRDAAYPLLVNQEKVNQQILKFEDAIRIGSAKLYYQAE